MTTSAASAPPTSEAAPVSARRAQTRERLMAAATDVFAERGVNGASVEEICEAAGFTRGAFYSNFVDKDALVLAMIHADMAAGFAAAEQAVGEIGPPQRDKPAAVISQALTRMDVVGRSTRAGVLAQRELMLHAARVPALHAPYRAFLELSTARLQTLIVGALERAGLEFTVPLDLALDLLLATHTSVQTRALFDQSAGPGTLQALILAITRDASPGDP